MIGGGYVGLVSGAASSLNSSAPERDRVEATA